MRLLKIICLSLLCASCISIGGIYSGYNQLSDQQKQRVKELSIPMEEVKADGNIYQIIHEQAMDLIRSQAEVLIYEYTPWCKSEYCANPLEVAERCKESNIFFCLITTTFEDISSLWKIELPIFAIRNEAYGTKVRAKYCRLFFDQLTGVPEKERGFGSFYLFRDGRFVQAYKMYQDALAKK